LIPFKLTAYKVNADGFGEYVIAFHDSRLHSVRFSLKDGRSFKEVVRAAVLDRVKRMSPLERYRDRALRQKQELLDKTLRHNPVVALAHD
jgi:hypothetical protein